MVLFVLSEAEDNSLVFDEPSNTAEVERHVSFVFGPRTREEQLAELKRIRLMRTGISNVPLLVDLLYECDYPDVACELYSFILNWFLIPSLWTELKQENSTPLCAPLWCAFITSLKRLGPDDPDVAARGCWVIPLICGIRKDIAAELGDVGACEITVELLGLFGSTEADVAKCGWCAVQSLAEGGSENRRRLGEASAPEVVVRTLLSIGKETGCGDFGCEAIYWMAQDEENKKKLIELGAKFAVKGLDLDQCYHLQLEERTMQAVW
jgi:hypothetical protein